MLDTLQSLFMQRAFLVGAIAAVPFGLIGTFVVVRRIGYLAGAIAHCALGGIGIGLYLQYVLAGTMLAGVALSSLFPPMGVAVVTTVFAAILVGVLRTSAGEREDTLIGAVWVIGMALGVLLFNKTPGNTNISNFLFGDILYISRADVLLISVLSAAVLLLVLLFFKRLEAVCFDEEFARLRGISTSFYFNLLLVLTALTVVQMVRIIGIILLIGMLTLPAAAAARLAHRLKPICLLAVLFSLLATWLGLVITAATDWVTGPTIVLVAAAIYFATFLPPLSKKRR